jgi:hypothetical protein
LSAIRSTSQLTAALVCVVLLSTSSAQTPAGSGTAPSFARAPGAGGIDFVLDNGATADKRVIETMPGGLAVFDADGAGSVDVFLANGVDPATGSKTDPRYWNRLYRNTGDGTFTDVTERAGLRGDGFAMGAVAADFDNDGHIDLFVPGVGIHTLYRNKGDGTVEDVTRAAGSR